MSHYNQRFASNRRTKFYCVKLLNSECCIAHESRKHAVLGSINYCGNNPTVGHMGFSLWNEPRFPCSQRPRFDDRRYYLADWIYLQKRILDDRACCRWRSLSMTEHSRPLNSRIRNRSRHPHDHYPQPSARTSQLLRAKHDDGGFFRPFAPASIRRLQLGLQFYEGCLQD